MRISFNPRINSSFTKIVMESDHVSKLIDDYELTEEEAHQFVKTVLITGFSKYEVDINKVINDVRDRAE